MCGSFSIGRNEPTLWYTWRWILNVELNCWPFAALLWTLFVALNEIIWKHELNAFMDFTNRFGSIWICADAQHIPSESCLNFCAWQWGHSLFVATNRHFRISGIFNKRLARRRNEAVVNTRCTCWRCRSFVQCLLTTNLLACLHSNCRCWFYSALASCDWNAHNCVMLKRTISLYCWICSSVLSAILFCMFVALSVRRPKWPPLRFADIVHSNTHK